MKNHTAHDHTTGNEQTRPHHSRPHHSGHGFCHRQEEGPHGQEESERHHGRGGHGRGEGRGRFGGHFGGPRGRARRGEARYVLLDALRDGPKHGYEIIKSLEERSGGQYTPSPGTVYPTMQYLEDLGLVRADQEAERRVFHLTDAGRADLETHAQEIADFWGRFGAAPSAGQPEAGYLRDELESLARTVWDGLRGPLSSGDTETARRVRTALECCRNEIREIFSRGGAA